MFLEDAAVSSCHTRRYFLCCCRLLVRFRPFLPHMTESWDQAGLSAIPVQTWRPCLQQGRPVITVFKAPAQFCTQITLTRHTSVPLCTITPSGGPSPWCHRVDIKRSIPQKEHHTADISRNPPLDVHLLQPGRRSGRRGARPVDRKNRSHETDNHSHLLIVLHPPRTAYRALLDRGETWPAPPEPRRSTPTGGSDSRTLRASLQLHVYWQLRGHVSTLLSAVPGLPHAADMARMPGWEWWDAAASRAGFALCAFFIVWAWERAPSAGGRRNCGYALYTQLRPEHDGKLINGLSALSKRKKNLPKH